MKLWATRDNDKSLNLICKFYLRRRSREDNISSGADELIIKTWACVFDDSWMSQMSRATLHFLFKDDCLHACPSFSLHNRVCKPFFNCIHKQTSHMPWTIWKRSFWWMQKDILHDAVVRFHEGICWFCKKSEGRIKKLMQITFYDRHKKNISSCDPHFLLFNHNIFYSTIKGRRCWWFTMRLNESFNNL